MTPHPGKRGDRIIIDDPLLTRREAEAAIINGLPQSKPPSARVAGLSGTALASGLAVHPQWVSQEVRP